jgi:hypothetical protein
LLTVILFYNENALPISPHVPKTLCISVNSAIREPVSIMNGIPLFLFSFLLSRLKEVGLWDFHAVPVSPTLTSEPDDRFSQDLVEREHPNVTLFSYKR